MQQHLPKKIEKAKHAVLLIEVLSAQPQQRKYYQLEYLDSLENTDVMGENFLAHIFLSVQSK